MSESDPSDDGARGGRPHRLPPGLWTALAVLTGAAPWVALLFMSLGS